MSRRVSCVARRAIGRPSSLASCFSGGSHRWRWTRPTCSRRCGMWALNPVRARLVARASDWPWSSVRADPRFRRGQVPAGADNALAIVTPVLERTDDFATFMAVDEGSGFRAPRRGYRSSGRGARVRRSGSNGCSAGRSPTARQGANPAATRQSSWTCCNRYRSIRTVRAEPRRQAQRLHHVLRFNLGAAQGGHAVCVTFCLEMRIYRLERR